MQRRLDKCSNWVARRCEAKKKPARAGAMGRGAWRRGGRPEGEAGAGDVPAAGRGADGGGPGDVAIDATAGQGVVGAWRLRRWEASASKKGAGQVQGAATTSATAATTCTTAAITRTQLPLLYC